MRLISLVAAFGFLAVGSASADDCFGKNELTGKIDPNASEATSHPIQKFEVNLDSMKARIGANDGVVTRAYCNNQNDGTKTIEMQISAHIAYDCKGFVFGASSNTVEMQCDGSNTSKNKVTAKLSKF
ncbi:MULTISPECIES: hypothetical protein [unclassified Roseovarius]|uniref:hypothetical protein n=1 Tax=unclassified Roseovarius TaxID=2614913 RepID=UPI00273F8A19|nr:MULTISPECIES: hypothetical protein [unclassified Roseovarius]